MPDTINAKRPPPVVVERVVGLHCPNDGREWHVQCARCGSSLSFEECANCGGEGVTGHDCGEDCCCCLDPDDNVVCDCCGGEGNFPECASQPSGWCIDHPLPGREAVHVNTPEWFTVEANSVIKPTSPAQSLPDNPPPCCADCGGELSAMGDCENNACKSHDERGRP